jgi:hypothetical protein
VTITAGNGGAVTGAGGTAKAGGAISITTGTGGAIATGDGLAGGALNLVSGAGGAGSTAGGSGGAITIATGAAGAGGTGTVGAFSLKQGGTGGTEKIGISTAGAISLVGATTVTGALSSTGIVSHVGLKGGSGTIVTNSDGGETLTEAQSGFIIVATKADGATTITLPDASAASIGVRYIITQVADQNLNVVLTTADGNGIVALNVATSDKVSFETSGEKIGAAVEIIGISATQWLAVPLQGTMTVEAAD